jgi:hypothetical protein
VRSSLLVWFGVLGAPAAWAIQHVAGFGVGQAACSRARLGVAVDPWTIGLTAGAAAIAVLAGLAAVVTWRATRDAGEEPPASRVHFLAVIGMTLTPLFLAIILMSGIGAVSLGACHQS